MRRTIRLLAVWVACLPLAAMGCDNKGNEGAATGAVAEANTAVTAAPAGTGAANPTSAAPTAAAETTPASTSTPAAAPSGTAAAGAAGTAAAPAAPSGAAESGPKQFDCGGKGQKACPMQGWMKGVMAAAASSGDGEKLAQALSYVAGKPPPGFGSWSSLASSGAAKAKAGDIDGAKASCKQCHDLYKEKYKTTMRDRPW